MTLISVLHTSCSSPPNVTQYIIQYTEALHATHTEGSVGPLVIPFIVIVMGFIMNGASIMIGSR